MKVTKQAVMDRLLDFSGPIDPRIFSGYEHCLDDLMTRWLDTEAFHKMELERKSWVEQVPFDETLAIFIDLLQNPPAEVSNSEFRDGWEANLVDYLYLLGSQHPLSFLAQIGFLVAYPESRSVVVHVIGKLGHSAGLPWLRPLVVQPDLTRKEITVLTEAIHEIGGEEKDTLLLQLRERVSHESDGSI